MSILIDEKYITLHQDAISEFDDIQSAQRDERLQCLQDRRFYSIAGAQWEGSLGEQFENKPKLEVNKIHLSVIRIINEYRNNGISVDYVSKEGEEDDQLADTCDGMYRADEMDSCADEAYDNAFEEAVGGGFGAYQFRAVYEDEEDDENEYQSIRIEPIYDADTSVFFDLNAKRQDKSDAKRCYKLTPMSRRAYEEQYGDTVSSWPQFIAQYKNFDWQKPDIVYLCELYEIEFTRDKVLIFQGLDGTEERHRKSELEEEDYLELKARGFTLAREKPIKRQRCHKYIMSGGGILEDNGYIAGKWIPIVPQYGKRWFVDGIERCMGHVRLMKDIQRLKNMQTSKLAEISAMGSYRKPIFLPEQVAGHKLMWEEDNIKNYPYLLVNPITDANGQIAPAGPVAYIEPPDIPPALAALLQISDNDLKELSGGQEAGEQLQPNLSGKAVELIQNRLDMQAFIYMSNAAKARQRGGEIWLSMARDLFVEAGRKKKTIDKQGKVGNIEIQRPIQNKETSETEYENDLTNANYDVYADVGPTSSSRRAATVRALTGMLTITDDPETKQVLSSMAMLNMEGEGISEVREFFRRKLVRLGVVRPTDEEQQQLMAEAQNQQPTPQDEYLRAAAEQAQADAAKSRADTVLKTAKAQESEANTIKTYAGIEQTDREQAMEANKNQWQAMKDLGTGE